MYGDVEALKSGRFLAESIAKALRRKTLSPPQQAFAAQIAADWRAEELPGFDADAFAAILADAWRFGEGFAGGAPLIRIAPARDSGLDLLAIVQEDRPFLVDSVMGELGDQGLDVRAMFHPVAEIGGREISMILVILSHVGEDRKRR